MADRGGLHRRKLVAGSAAAVGTVLLGGCDRIAGSEDVQNVLGKAEGATRRVQRLLTAQTSLAREYSEADLSPAFKSNGTSEPDDEDYQDLAANQFADWRLEVGGLVQRPTQFSLAEIRDMPSRTQITRHDCVEGWSCIAKWKGAVLGPLLQQVGLQENARYLVFYCADPMEGQESKYYESIDLEDAFHPQTILAYEMNDRTLPIPHGAPLRLRVERQLGYKMAKYIMRVELVESFTHIAGGKGGWWEDRGYTWYAGI
jgi:DMSO/TMAO reductase YedYZ molybdopterin-dependent catalytic subunit